MRRKLFSAARTSSFAVSPATSRASLGPVEKPVTEEHSCAEQLLSIRSSASSSRRRKGRPCKVPPPPPPDLDLLNESQDRATPPPLSPLPLSIEPQVPSSPPEHTTDSPSLEDVWPAPRRRRLVAGLKAESHRYTKAEDEVLVNYIVQKNAYSLIDGLKLWQMLESENLLPGRSHHSMKERFRRRLHCRIHTFALTETQIQYFELAKCRANYNQLPKPEIDGTRSNFYHKSEDEAIVNYLSSTNQLSKVGGNVVWISLERSGLIPGRSWQSLKERFRKAIQPTLASSQV